MCLIEEVLHWDMNGVRCRSTSHRLPDNPLRADGRLGAACGIEYAAQAMALHGALAGAHQAGPRGYLASVRDVRLFVPYLDDIASDLTVAAGLITSDPATALYEFSLRAADRLLVSGRATIVFDIGRAHAAPSPQA